MRALYLTPTGLETREVPIPTPADTQVLARTLSCGICEGDVFHYRTCAELTRSYLLGHEGTGEIVALGAAVRGLALGDVITANGGAMADYFVAEATRLRSVPAGLDPLRTHGEPIACCVHAANRFGIRLGDRVALIGCGYMGLMCLQLARLQGPAHLVAIEPIPWRRDAALAFGADVAVDPTGRSPQDLLAALGEFDVIIEATGVQAAIDMATALVRQHGRFVLVGYHQQNHGQRTVDMQTWNFKAIDVVNGHVRREDEKVAAMRQGLALMAAGRLRAAELVTAYLADQAQQAFEDLVARKEGLFKAALTY